MENLDNSLFEYLRRPSLEFCTTTDFFREIEIYNQYYHYVMDLIKTKNSLRLLSSPCSTGEEAYSIKLTHLCMDKHELFIDACDVSRKLVNIATCGIYENNSLGRLAFGFSRLNIDSKYKIRRECLIKNIQNNRGSLRFVLPDEVNSNISFFRADIMELEGENLYDIIHCRNFLYHLKKDGMEKVLQKVGELSKPEGLIVLDPLFFIPKDSECITDYISAIDGAELIKEKKIKTIGTKP